MDQTGLVKTKACCSSNSVNQHHHRPLPRPPRCLISHSGIWHRLDRSHRRRGAEQGPPLTGLGDPLMSLVKPCHDWPRPDGKLGSRARKDGTEIHNWGRLFVAMQMLRRNLVGPAILSSRTEGPRRTRRLGPAHYDLAALPVYRLTLRAAIAGSEQWLPRFVRMEQVDEVLG